MNEWIKVENRLPTSKDKMVLAQKNNDPKAKAEVLKEVATIMARVLFPKTKAEGSYGNSLSDHIGEFKKDGVVVGWYVRGESVLATRIPSHGPASTGAFEAVDYLEGEGNQVIVHEDFSVTSGSISCSVIYFLIELNGGDNSPLDQLTKQAGSRFLGCRCTAPAQLRNTCKTRYSTLGTVFNLTGPLLVP